LHYCAAIALDPKIDSDHDVRHNAPLGTLLSTRLIAAITHPCNLRSHQWRPGKFWRQRELHMLLGRIRIIV